MGTGTDGRFLAVASLVVAALLGSAYVLGRSMVPEPAEMSPHAHAPITADGLPPREASQGPGQARLGPTPSTPGTASHSPGASGSPSRSPGETSQDGEPRSPVGTVSDGPYGTQATSGSAAVALTFDDGPDPRYTPQALELLRAYHVKATFCVVGENALNHPDLIQAIAADGHTLCNHSWNHDVTLGQQPADMIRDDLLRTNAAIRSAVPNARIAYFRQPGGAWTYPVVSVAEELGMTPLHWTVDPTDWQAPGAERIAATVTGEASPGAVVLLHDAGGDRQGTIDALHRILPELSGRFRLMALPTGTT